MCEGLHISIAGIMTSQNSLQPEDLSCSVPSLILNSDPNVNKLHPFGRSSIKFRAMQQSALQSHQRHLSLPNKSTLTPNKTKHINSLSPLNEIKTHGNSPINWLSNSKDLNCYDACEKIWKYQSV